MIDKETIGLIKIRRALISVSDKTGLVEFTRELRKFDIEIISTGGTANALREAGIEVRDVSSVTGFPEMMDGRIKTLHPGIHGGLLAIRDNPDHITAMSEHGIQPIDLVVVNLYPFERTVAKPGVALEDAIEQIDIGGPAMIRSAAKNFKGVAVVVSPQSYRPTLRQLGENDGAVTLEFRRGLAFEAFSTTSSYDSAIAHYFKQLERKELGIEAADDSLPDAEGLMLGKMVDLRYGENPHQRAALYSVADRYRTDALSQSGIARAELLSGKEMSFNNYVDADSAWQLVCDFEETACAIIKHTNPAGVGLATSPEEAYRKALATDPVSAFGGIVAFNCQVDATVARALTEIFTEVLIAPEYEVSALEILRIKKNLRVLRVGLPTNSAALEYKQIGGGLLAQTSDRHKLERQELKTVTKRKPTENEIRALLFAWIVCKHTKSNAIVYAQPGQTVGVGAGQMSRVDAVKIGAMRARLPIKGAVLASDGFFPFRDGLDEAAKHGISAVIQPGGSVRDDEVVQACDENDIAMVFTGIRHFKH